MVTICVIALWYERLAVCKCFRDYSALNNLLCFRKRRTRSVCAISLLSLHDYNMKLPNLTFYGLENRGQLRFFFFFLP